MAFFTKESLLTTYAYLYLVMEKHGMLDNGDVGYTDGQALSMFSSKTDTFYGKAQGDKSAGTGKKTADQIRELHMKQKAQQKKANEDHRSGQHLLAFLKTGAANGVSSQNARKEPIPTKTNPNVAQFPPNTSGTARLKAAAEARNKASQETTTQQSCSSGLLSSDSGSTMAASTSVPSNYCAASDERNSFGPQRGQELRKLRASLLELELKAKEPIKNKFDFEDDLVQAAHHARLYNEGSKKWDAITEKHYTALNKLIKEYDVTCRGESCDWKNFAGRVFCSGDQTTPVLCEALVNKISAVIEEEKVMVTRREFEIERKVAAVNAALEKVVKSFGSSSCPAPLLNTFPRKGKVSLELIGEQLKVCGAYDKEYPIAE